MFQLANSPRLLGSLFLLPATMAAYATPTFTERGESMSFLSWIVLGLVAGFIGSMLANRRGEGVLLDILLGMAGAFAGGWLFHIFGAAGITGLNIYSIFVAVVGSVVLLSIYHLFRRRRRVF